MNNHLNQLNRSKTYNVSDANVYFTGQQSGDEYNVNKLYFDGSSWCVVDTFDNTEEYIDVMHPDQLEQLNQFILSDILKYKDLEWLTSTDRTHLEVFEFMLQCMESLEEEGYTFPWLDAFKPEKKECCPAASMFVCLGYDDDMFTTNHSRTFWFYSSLAFDLKYLLTGIGIVSIFTVDDIKQIIEHLKEKA